MCGEGCGGLGPAMPPPSAQLRALHPEADGVCAAAQRGEGASQRGEVPPGAIPLMAAPRGRGAVLTGDSGWSSQGSRVAP